MAATIYRTKDGTRVPGASTISKLGESSGGLVHWAWSLGMDGKDYRQARDDAAEAGSIGHLLVEAAIKHLPVDAIVFPTDGAKALGINAYRAYQDWQESSKIKWVESEISLVSEKYRYGGTIDAIGIADGANSYDLGDWKSGALYPSHLSQIAAYGKLFEESTGHSIRRYHLCRFNRMSGDFTHFSTDNLEDAFEAFKHQRALYDLLATLKKRL